MCAIIPNNKNVQNQFQIIKKGREKLRLLVCALYMKVINGVFCVSLVCLCVCVMINTESERKRVCREAKKKNPNWFHKNIFSLLTFD